MKPQARIQATIDILERIKANTRIPMDGVVGDYMRQRRYIGSKDRSNVAERVYEIARAHARLGWWLEQSKIDDTPRNRTIAYIALCEKADQKRICGLFDGSKYAPEPLNDGAEKLTKNLIGKDLEHKDMPLAVRVECPPLYEEKLKTYFGKDFEEEMRAIIPGATLDMRVNTFLCDPEKAKNYLEADGVVTDTTPFSPIGLRARDKTYISRTKAWGKGWIEIQDEGSQLIAHICNAQPGMQVLDFCAGAGGKTLALAAAMKRKGRIVAMDLDERRLKKGKDRYKKAQVADIIETRALSEDRQRKWLKRQKEKFDIVLLDVPCTGTGTWRRNPDMRWTVYGPALEELTEIQAEILERAHKAVKPGGKLVYATCSLLPDENENQIEAFLKNHPEFEIAPLDEGLGLGTPYMRLTPHRHKTDGFFAAVLVRKEIKEKLQLLFQSRFIVLNMLKIILCFAVFFLYLPSSAQAKEKPALSFPLNCTLKQNCWSVNYVDVDPTNSAKDFTCAAKTYDDHKGTDFALRSLFEMRAGVDVLAASAGTVLRIRDGESDAVKTDDELQKIKNDKKECGNGILIDHSAAGFPGWRTMYCHLKKDSIIVKPKDVLKAGQKIAQIGQSGLAEFPHLHFGVIWEEDVIDPYTGASDHKGCGQVKKPLWKEPLPYEPLSIYNAGFRSKIPDFKAIENGVENPDVLSTNENTLIFWSALYGVQKNDQIHIIIKNPDGKIFAQRKIIQEKNRAQQYYYTGRKLKDQVLKRGNYSARITIKRENFEPFTRTEKTTLK